MPQKFFSLSSILLNMYTEGMKSGTLDEDYEVVLREELVDSVVIFVDATRY